MLGVTSYVSVDLSPFPLLGVAAHQGQSQLSNLLEQAFEPAMFVDP